MASRKRTNPRAGGGYGQMGEARKPPSSYKTPNETRVARPGPHGGGPTRQGTAAVGRRTSAKPATPKKPVAPKVTTTVGPRRTKGGVSTQQVRASVAPTILRAKKITPSAPATRPAPKPNTLYASPGTATRRRKK